MKKKHLFSAVALAAVFAGCSQDELFNESNFQGEDNRPTVEAPVITLGSDTRMSTSNSYAGVAWENGDGFGAMLMDTYNSQGKTWSEMFPIESYVSSNILYKTEDGVNFRAEASLKQGNYLFYAPFNEDNFKREPLAVKLPTVQNVVPSTTDAPSNTAIKEFYEAKTYPVFVAYDSIWNTPKTNLALSMKHIYALPKITLKLGKVRLANKTSDETSIAIDAIKFTNKGTNKIVTAGTINNEHLVAYIGKGADGKIVWDDQKFETAATGDIVDKANAANGGEEAVEVKFDPALTITGDKDGEFFMVLPGAAYTRNDLAIEVYTTINGESYVLATNSTDATSAKTIQPARDVRLLPGLPYAADEYNADGSMKESKGTSATYTVEGGFILAETAAASGYTEIKSYSGLINFIENVAYRGEPLIEMTKAEAEAIMENNGNVAPDPKKYFVITVDDNSPIELDDAFVTAFKNSCVIAGGNASIAFKPNSSKVTLGDITYSTDEQILFNAGGVAYNISSKEIEHTLATINETSKTYVTGNVVVEGEAAPAFGVLYVNKDASVTLSADLKVGGKGFTRVDNYGGTITSNTKDAVLKIQNFAGEAVINETLYTGSQLYNGTDNADDAEATMNLNADVTVNSNNASGTAIVTSATVKFETNNGLVVAGDDVAKITVSAGAGSVDNTNNGKITNTANQTVYATINGSEGAAGFSAYDNLSELTKIVLTGRLNVTAAAADDVNELFATGALQKVKVIDFNAGSSLVLAGGVDLDWSSIDEININANVKWSGRAENSSTVTVKTGAIQRAAGAQFTSEDITISEIS